MFYSIIHVRALPFIQGDPIHYNHSFKLPEQIGELQQLKKLELLNVPLKIFPSWILKLTNLEYLMIRGNGITEIPNGIDRLDNLKILRIEDCELANLPFELSQMHHLKESGLRDIRLTEIKADMFPRNLMRLDFCGAGYYNIDDLKQLKADLTGINIYP